MPAATGNIAKLLVIENSPEIDPQFDNDEIYVPPVHTINLLHSDDDNSSFQINDQFNLNQLTIYHDDVKPVYIHDSVIVSINEGCK